MAATTRQPINERGEYLKKVLAPAAKTGAIPDLFARYGIDPSESDPGVIEAQLAFAVKLWRNTTGHPNYGDLIRLLLKEHADYERVLRDPSAREAARHDLFRSREIQAQAGLVEFDSLIAELRDISGALPESTRRHLEEVGAEQLGLSREEIGRKLGAERFVDDIGKDRPCLDRARYKAIGKQLTALRGVLHSDDAGPTLFSFIGAPFSLSGEQFRELYSSAKLKNERRLYEDESVTLVNRVLVDVRRYLVEGDSNLYRNAVVADVKDSLRERIQRYKKLHDRLEAGAYRSLVADARRLGLDEKWAAVAVRELARSERMAIEDGVHPARERPGTGAVPVPYARTTPPVPPSAPPVRPVPPPPPVRQDPPVHTVQPPGSHGDQRRSTYEEFRYIDPRQPVVPDSYQPPTTGQDAPGSAVRTPRGRARRKWRFWVGIFFLISGLGAVVPEKTSPGNPGWAVIAFTLAVGLIYWARKRSSGW